jgi:hypothetical protein
MTGSTPEHLPVPHAGKQVPLLEPAPPRRTGDAANARAAAHPEWT